MYVIKYGNNKMDKIDFLLISFGAACFAVGWMLQLFSMKYSHTLIGKLIILAVVISLFSISICIIFQL